MIAASAFLAIALDRQMNRSSIEMSIYVPKYSEVFYPRIGKRQILDSGPDSHFAVIYRNVSRRTQELFVDGSSWGDYTLEFALRTPGGKPAIVRRRQHGYSKNIPVTVRLEPGDSWVRNVYFDTRSAFGWEGFPDFKRSASVDCTLTAIFTQEPLAKPSAQSKASQPDPWLWTGTIRSAPVQVTFTRY